MKKKLKLLLCFLLSMTIWVNIAPVVHAQEPEKDQNKILSPYFLVESGDTSAESFPLKETSVSVNISNIIADTHITQVYANNGETPINAKYVFPASTKVSVHGMTMQIGDQLVTAQIKEREEAEEEFEEAKSEGKSASLMEQQRPNVFTMEVANVMPGDEIRIELHYTEMIEPSEGTYEFVFPTVTGPRYVSESTDPNDGTSQWVETPYLHEGATPPGTYDINVNLSAGVPITDLSCKSHDVQISWKEQNNTQAQISLADKTEFSGNRDFILTYKLTGQDTSSGLLLSTAPAESGGENFFLLTIQPPERVEPEAIPPREYIFVLDVSGSMSGYPLDTAKRLIKNLVSSLEEQDSFNLILFANDAIPMASKSVPATEQNIRKALDLIDQQEGSGGTEMADALRGAVALSSQNIDPSKEDISRSIVVITDGYISGEREIFEIINNNLASVSFFPFGIGTSVNRYLIEGIAKAGQGEPFIVTDDADADQMAERFRTYIQSPVLTNINVKIDGFDVYDVEPQSVPTLFSQKPITLMGKWRGEAAGTIEITGQTGSGPYSESISVAENATQTAQSDQTLAYLWARKRLERITDYGLNTSNPDIKQEVTQLGLNYSMLTPYTSFIAVVDIVRNPDGEATDVDQPLPLPLEVSDLAVSGYTLGSEPGLLLPALLAAFLFLRKPWCKKRSSKNLTIAVK